MAILAWTALAVTLSIAGPASAEPGSTAIPQTRRIERNYVLSARVRPLLFWFHCNDVGSGKITWSSDGDGRQGLEFLIGSDPEKVPMRINRWGYISEFHDRQTASVFGVMTQAEETTPDEAKKKVEKLSGTGHPYRALHSTIEAGESITTIFQLALPNEVTYRELDRVRNEVTNGRATLKKSAVPGNTDPGLLSALAQLVSASVAAFQDKGKLAKEIKRRYVYASGIHDVAVRETKAVPAFLAGGNVHRALESSFEDYNHTTGQTTRFQIIYGVDAPISGTPLRIVFRPNFWFEAELNIKPNQWR